MRRDIAWVSQRRLEPYIDQTGGNQSLAWDLYEWNASISAALFEIIHHTEVLLRNAMMRELEKIHPLAFPWHAPNTDTIGAVAQRLSDKSSNTIPDENDLISQLNLGFWSQLVFSKDFRVAELWNSNLGNAFPGQSDRKVVGRAIEAMRELRNRVSHQDSLLHVDPAVELKKILRLASWIDPDAARWIESRSRVETVLNDRPVNSNEPDTVLFASTRNTEVQNGYNNTIRYPLFDTYYQKSAVILEDSIRVSREVTHVGFYLPKNNPQKNPDPSSFLANQNEAHIAPIFPRIERKVVPIKWSREEVEKLKKGDAADQRLASVMSFGLAKGYGADRSYVVYFLSAPGESPTNSDTNYPILHTQAGRGSAFVKQTRYLSLNSLRGAHQTGDLL